MHLQYRTKPGGGEFHAKLCITLKEARTQQYLKGNTLIRSTDEAVTEVKAILFKKEVASGNNLVGRGLPSDLVWACDGYRWLWQMTARESHFSLLPWTKRDDAHLTPLQLCWSPRSQQTEQVFFIPLPITAALWMGWGEAFCHEAPWGVVHFCTALSAKKAYCSAWAWPDVSRTLNSSRSFWTPSAKGSSVAALTAWKHSSGARYPRACFFSFTRASLRNASMLGSFGTGLRLSLRGSSGWPGGRKIELQNKAPTSARVQIFTPFSVDWECSLPLFLLSSLHEGLHSTAIWV